MLSWLREIMSLPFGGLIFEISALPYNRRAHARTTAACRISKITIFCYIEFNLLSFKIVVEKENLALHAFSLPSKNVYFTSLPGQERQRNEPDC